MDGHPLFAAVYDRMLAANEAAGLRRLRAELLAAARGRTLEIGAGTGLNLDHYPSTVSELVLTEPDPSMANRLRQRAAESPVRPWPLEVAPADADDLPFESDSFDTVVSTLVLCSVPEPERTLREIRRVLRPGGTLLYIEHVHDRHGTPRARWQDRLERPWSWLMGGCHPNRKTDRLIAQAFEGSAAQVVEFPGPATALVKPLARGIARKRQDRHR